MPIQFIQRYLIIILLFVAHVSAADELPKENLYPLPEQKNATFYLLTPPDYTKEKSYPLIISLHGAGEKGDRMVRYWKDAAAKRGMILLCPNSHVYGWDQESAMNILRSIDHVSQSYSINKEKIMLSGISAGGSITYALGLAGKGSIPYLNPMSTALQDQYLSYAQEGGKAKIYITHGAKDEMISAEQGGEAAAKKLSGKGFDVTFVLRPEDGHEVPEGEQDAILNWFVPEKVTPIPSSTP